MKLEDLLMPEDIFHPKVFYEGEWLLGGEFSSDCMDKDYLLLNSKTKNGQNAYMEFLENYYYKPLEKILDSKSLARNFFPKIALTVDEKEGRRVVRFAVSVFITEQILGLFNAEEMMKNFGEFAEHSNSIEEYTAYLKQLLREDRKVFLDVRSNGKNSPYFNEVYQEYIEYVKYSNSKMNFSGFLAGRIGGATKLIIATRYYPQLFSKEILIEPLMEAFDYDKFCLIAARSALDCCKTTEERENKVDNNATYVKLYLNAVEKLRRENPSYNSSIVIVNEKQRKQVVTIEDIQREYEALLSRHPEFSMISISDGEVSTLLRKEGVEESEIASFDLSSKENRATLEAIVTRLKADRELAAEWEFIRKGSSESVSSFPSAPQHPTQSLSEDERIRRMIIGREYLEDSNYVYKIYGIHKFEGYVGYIYANGSVIFEKYYENISTKKVASSSATYVMGLDNFMEMSKLSKMEIIRMMHRDSTTNVKRIFHREDMDRWKSDIARVIEGTDYTDEVMAYIDTLISHQDLHKSEVKS